MPLPLEPSCPAAEPRLRFYDLAEGSGAQAADGSRVVVHFECRYRGLSVVSSRAARTLGGNRTVAEVGGQRLSRLPHKLLAELRASHVCQRPYRPINPPHTHTLIPCSRLSSLWGSLCLEPHSVK